MLQIWIKIYLGAPLLTANMHSSLKKMMNISSAQCARSITALIVVCHIIMVRHALNSRFQALILKMMNNLSSLPKERNSSNALTVATG